jgi:hypothetical protein
MAERNRGSEGGSSRSGDRGDAYQKNTDIKRETDVRNSLGPMDESSGGERMRNDREDRSTDSRDAESPRHERMRGSSEEE